MKTMEVAVLRIYIPHDEAHLDRVLQAIEDFRPSGEVIVSVVRSILDSSNQRLPLDQQQQFMIEYFEETCRARIFVDALHEDIKPAKIMGSFVFMVEGDSEVPGGAAPNPGTAEAQG